MNRSQIVELLRLLNVREIREYDGWVSSSCPFAPLTHHSGLDKHPSFGISVEETSAFNCFACGRKGRLRMLPTLLHQVLGVDPKDLRAFIAKNEGVLMETTKKAIKVKPIHELVLEHDFSDLTFDFRGINKSSVSRHGLRWDPKERRVIFPIRDRSGRLVGIRGRAVGNDGLRYKSYSNYNLGADAKSGGIWYGMELPLIPSKKLVLVEGEIDSILLRQLGAANVWASMGASLTPLQIEAIRDVKNPLLLFFDDDEGGAMAKNKVVEKCKGLMPIFVVSNYFGCKDAARSVSKGVISQVLKSAVRIA